VLGLEGSELLVGRLASGGALANVLQRGPGLAADDELVSSTLLGDDEIALQATADFDVKLLLHPQKSWQSLRSRSVQRPNSSHSRHRRGPFSLLAPLLSWMTRLGSLKKMTDPVGSNDR